MVVLSGWLSNTAGLPVLAAFAVTILAGAAVGLWHGLLDHPPRDRRRSSSRSSRSSFAAGADEAIAQTPIPISSHTFLDVAGSTVGGVPIAVIILVVIALLRLVLPRAHLLGRQVYAVGGNREAARLAGIPTNRRIVLAYIVSGSCAGVVGIIFASQLTSGTADSTTGYELTAIASAVIGGVSLIGGQGRIIGVVAGAALLVVLKQGLVAISVNAYYQSMVVALVLLIAVVADRVRVRRLERIGARVARPRARAPPRMTASSPRKQLEPKENT